MAEPIFYSVRGHLIFGVPAGDVILDEVGPPPYPAPRPVTVHWSRPVLYPRRVR